MLRLLEKDARALADAQGTVAELNTTLGNERDQKVSLLTQETRQQEILKLELAKVGEKAAFYEAAYKACQSAGKLSGKCIFLRVLIVGFFLKCH